MTAAKNEEKYIENTLKAVVKQIELPRKWIIVDDGSIDNTKALIKKYAREYEFIRLVENNCREDRNFGAQVRAINIGWELLKNDVYDYIGNLDADVSFKEDYYITIIQRMAANQRLGLAGGFIYEEKNGIYKERRYNNETSVAHAIQLFKRECFEEIGGYLELKYGGPDWVAEVTARMKGWEVKAYKDVQVKHHRMTTSAEGLVKGRFKQGLMDYSVGSHPIFEVVKCIRRLGGEPYIIGAIVRLCGYVVAAVRDEKRIVSNEFLEYLRKEQMKRLSNIYRKKR